MVAPSSGPGESYVFNLALMASRNPAKSNGDVNAKALTHLLCLRRRQPHPIPPSLPSTHVLPPLRSDICSPPTLHCHPPISQLAPRKRCLSAAPLFPVRESCTPLSALPHLEHPGSPRPSAGVVHTKMPTAILNSVGHKVLLLGQWVW